MHKLGVTPPLPTAATTNGSATSGIGGNLPSASISNGFHATAAASTADHVTTSDAAAAATSASAATGSGVAHASLPKAEAKFPANASTSVNDVKGTGAAFLSGLAHCWIFPFLAAEMELYKRPAKCDIGRFCPCRSFFVPFCHLAINLRSFVCLLHHRDLNPCV